MLGESVSRREVKSLHRREKREAACNWLRCRKLTSESSRTFFALLLLRF
jgi:hypothetical protein